MNGKRGFWATAAVFYGIVSASAAPAEENTQVKEAYNAGLRNAIKVIKHEASQAFSEIPKGYCIEIRTVDNKRTDDFSAVKIETLGLVYLNMKPSLLEYVNPDGKKEKMLCLAIKPTRAYAKSALDDIRDTYPKIDAYYPSIVHISNPEAYKRIVPTIGELHEDKKAFIANLIHDNEAQKREFEHKIEQKDKRISALEAKIKKIASLIGSKGLLSDADEDGDLEESENTKKENTKAQNKPWSAAKKRRYPIISAGDTDIRYEDKKSGIKVEYADKSNPRILRVEKVDIGKDGVNPNRYHTEK